MKGTKITDYFTKLILSTLMSFSLVFPLTTTLEFSYKYYEVAVLSLIILVLLSIMLITPKITKVASISIPFILLALIIYLFIKDILYYVYDPFIWLADYIKGVENINESYSMLITILFNIGLSFFVFIFTFKKFNFIIIAIVGVAIFSSQWAFRFFVDRAYISFYTFSASILVYYFLHIYYRKSKENSINVASFTSFFSFVLPISILIIIITNFIPASSTPIKWGWMDGIIENVYNSINLRLIGDGKFSDIKGMGMFSLKYIGFGSSESLGGDMRIDNTKVLEVESEERIYLRGRSSNLYKDNRWDLSYNNDPDDIFEFSNLNDLYNFNNLKLSKINYCIMFGNEKPSYKSIGGFWFDQLSLYEQSNVVKVTYKDIKTTSIFSPLIVGSFEFEEKIKKDLINVNIDKILHYDDSFKSDYSYSFSSLYMNTDSWYFGTFMPMSYEGLYYNQFINIIKTISDFIIENPYTELKNYFEENYHIDSDELNDVYLDRNMIERAEFSQHNRLLSHYYLSNLDDMSILEVLIASLFSDLNSIDDYKTDKFKSRFISFIGDYLFLEFADYGYDINFFYNYAEQAYYELPFDLVDYYLVNKYFAAYSSFVFDNYTFIPQTVPDRVYELANDIIKGETNNYEKAKAIEKYLSENYFYTLLPGNTPDERDFVDYFLFDIEEGYCTYFATSMAILARCVGIPTRYIEGYRLPLNKSENGIYEVTNREAHAWVEAYFEGIGWITFEPTATYNFTFYNPDSTPPPYLMNQVRSDSIPRDYIFDTPDDIIQYPLYNDEDQRERSLLIILAVLLVISIILLIVIFNMLRRKLKLRKLYKMSSRECIIKLYEHYLRVLHQQKKPIMDGETPLEYAKRIDAYGYFYPYSFSEIADVFVKARYSQQEMTEEEKEKVFKFYKNILDFTRKNLKLKYLFWVF
ncbi:UNVERIFIED_CONTAM: Transglutaminase-like enzymes, putative cysteine proteases [Acetivibrio alkalicellulosi]